MHHALERRPLRPQTQHAITSEIRALLDLPLDRVAPATNFAVFAKSLGAEIMAESNAPTAALVGALVENAECPGRRLVYDVAEILCLPREARREYRSNRTGAPPYRIRKILLEYALKARHLDVLTGVLTKSFCATTCERLPVGCCSILGYDMGLVPQTMLTVQALEAQRRGWEPPARETKCRYHASTGCMLALFKSPACTGYLCEALVTNLRRVYTYAPLSEFLDRLAIFRTCYLDRVEIFDAMDATMRAGARLVVGRDTQRGRFSSPPL